ncbi:hypothetical protein LCGC14_2355640 [marine sediment metagenome]|uniref:Uncharacterized protein n=1 Tax=marine sediment metagenome TaxID=412755 RepID=A0A0F9CVD1_9ZZZZ
MKEVEIVGFPYGRWFWKAIVRIDRLKKEQRTFLFQNHMLRWIRDCQRKFINAGHSTSVTWSEPL